MKSTLLFFAVTYSSFLFSQSNDWKYLGKKDSEKTIFYFKTNSNDTGWIKSESPETVYYDKNQKKVIDGYQITLWKFDCDERQIGLVQTTTYDKKGNVKKTLSLKSFQIEMDYAVPDSLGEDFLKAFCEE